MVSSLEDLAPKLGQTEPHMIGKGRLVIHEDLGILVSSVGMLISPSHPGACSDADSDLLDLG